MVNPENEIPVYIDTIPNLLTHPLIGEDQIKYLASSIEARHKLKIPEAVKRYATLPAIIVRHDEYCKLLMEARELFVEGYFYSCVAMCGITAERIIKDILGRSLLILKGNVERPKQDAIKWLESFNTKAISNFLISAGILGKDLKKPLQDLAELRNKYTHAGGKTPEQDAAAAIGYLHKIIDGTVSIFKDYEIREGKLFSKK